MQSPDIIIGPHWEPGLIAPDGRLRRLHKGGVPKVDPAPPPVRESASDVQYAADEQRKQAAGGSYLASLKKPKPTLFSQQATASGTPGLGTLLGAAPI